jgi:hypothetical protein
MPDEVPKTKDDVPEGFTVVVLAALLIPINFATLSFSYFSAYAANFIS